MPQQKIRIRRASESGTSDDSQPVQPEAAASVAGELEGEAKSDAEFSDYSDLEAAASDAGSPEEPQPVGGLAGAAAPDAGSPEDSQPGLAEAAAADSGSPDDSQPVGGLAEKAASDAESRGDTVVDESSYSESSYSESTESAPPTPVLVLPPKPAAEQDAGEPAVEQEPGEPAPITPPMPASTTVVGEPAPEPDKPAPTPKRRHTMHAAVWSEPESEESEASSSDSSSPVAGPKPRELPPWAHVPCEDIRPSVGASMASIMEGADVGPIDVRRQFAPRGISCF